MKITAKYLTKVYADGTYALDDFSVRIESGEIVCVLGESGCGKTTLLRLLSGLEKPTAGELYFDDVLYSDLPLKQRDTAVVFQEYVLYPKMTVWENVAAALQRYELPREEEERKIYKTLSELGLLSMKNRLPRDLSGGQQQRVALARAMVRNPSLFLFDEPLSNIAPEQRHEYIRLLKEIKGRLPDATFIYVTHNPREAMAIGDKLLIMSRGKVLQYGEKSRVRKNPYNADVLRTICTDHIELNGKIISGEFIGDNGETIKFGGVENHERASVIYNPYNDGKPYPFDADGNAIAGEKRICYFDGVYDGKKLAFGGTELITDDDFRKRFIGKTGGVKVGIESIKLKTYGVYGDIKIPAEKCGDKFTAGGSEFTVADCSDFAGAFYVDRSDIYLYEGKRRVLAHYKVYNAECAGKATGDMLRLPCGSLKINSGGYRGAVKVSFNRKAYITPVKRGGIRAICLAEDDLGDVKIVYCILKGFDRYVTFFADKAHKFFGVKKLRLSVKVDGISLLKIR